MKLRKDYLPFGKPDFSQAEIDAVSAVLRSGWVGMGPETLAFERELAAFIGAPHVVTVNSCTSALFLSLLVHGIGPGDEVICPSLTWYSTANAALYLGARPVFCDVDPDTYCLTAAAVRARLSAKTKAAMAVHMGGLAADVDAIRAVLPEGVALIEDAAHALGARYCDGPMVGSAGNLTCFSFYANKNLSTGEGGAIALDDEQKAQRLRSLRLHGLASDAWDRFRNPKACLAPDARELGYKMNYTDLQAAIGRVQLRRQAELAARRKAVAGRYVERLAEAIPGIKFQSGVEQDHHARHLFLVELPLEQLTLTRDEILLRLRERRIGAAIHYPPLHRMRLYAGDAPVSLPHTEYICERILTLPISGGMRLDDADYVAAQLIDILQGAWK